MKKLDFCRAGGFVYFWANYKSFVGKRRSAFADRWALVSGQKASLKVTNRGRLNLYSCKRLSHPPITPFSKAGLS
ncbi:MAG: hypothetical protein A2527_06785 [Candidatus Lambdaproteobacteria bacterium RIFOXYD2_FULL_50_16]|uniref:Uncharacterized protein n=1 Tax=Candidatus Lambdaproteobacteria bacterium RIFOXYD2_FULL_50_16 TaxID=1817772 RepID=A0A1F6GBN6_9PROT|nr:MAG: hypothetical protein A2527_06785 [Candidatus Lambdaproteobacteria bacterium RIFOXYD2_FULL_50_16]